MLWTLIGVLFLVWLILQLLEVAGGLIHILLVVALIVLAVQLIQGRRP